MVGHRRRLTGKLGYAVTFSRGWALSDSPVPEDWKSDSRVRRRLGMWRNGLLGVRDRTIGNVLGLRKEETCDGHW